MKKAIIIILTAVVLVLVAVGFYLYKNYSDNDNELEEYTRQSDMFNDLIPNINKSDFLAESRKVNPQIVAWLTIPDSKIDFPIVQCEDNEYYLNHDFENNESYMGVPFLDYRSSADFSDFNSIIYGHNISNKYMFYSLLNFKAKDYFDLHSYGYLVLTDKKYKINFLACAVVKSDGFAYNTVFLSQKERVAFYSEVKENAVQLRDFRIDELLSAQILTLSTCSYEFNDARTVLIGYLEDITESS